MKKEFTGCVALVTGAASGIGKAIALSFGESGAVVVVADIDRDGGGKVVSEIVELGGQAIFVKTDVTDEVEVEGLLEETVRYFGRLDFACNNAGIEGKTANIAESKKEDWDKTIDTDLKGVWLCMKHECRQMLQQKSGVIVNISSIMGMVAAPGISPYVAAKHGVIGLSKAVALEYAAEGLRVNAVCPGGIYTPIINRALAIQPEVVEALTNATPHGDLGQPHNIADAVMWLCSSGASFVNGQAIAVDGGYTAQ
jgi:NAD(P)-dependent dehydrogenase (short-subunit alcohol dehydrogenase family)